MRDNPEAFAAPTAVQREAEALRRALERFQALIEDQFDSLESRKRTIAELEREGEAGEAAVRQLREEIVRLEGELAKADLLFAPRYRDQSIYYGQFVESPLTDEARRIM